MNFKFNTEGETKNKRELDRRICMSYRRVIRLTALFSGGFQGRALLYFKAKHLVEIGGSSVLCVSVSVHVHTWCVI